MLRLHHAPLACSFASRLALIETGLPHEIAFVRTWKGEQHAEAYRRVNPRGKVPALETEQGVITESTAILPYIADLVPGKQLLPPPGSFARARGQSWLSFLSSTLHCAISAAMHPLDGCESEPAAKAAVAKVAAAFADVNNHLEGREYLLDAFSVCDLYLLVFSLWRSAPEFAGKLSDLPHLDAFQQRMMARPGFVAALGEELGMRAEAMNAKA